MKSYANLDPKSEKTKCPIFTPKSPITPQKSPLS
jgi:hypothetical protein